MTNTMNVKVYLNHGGMFRKFDPATAELHLAAEFELDVGSDDASFHGHPIDADVYAALELVFKQLNVGGDLVPATEWTRRYRAEGNRSLSVGDVVVIGEIAYSVGSFGWHQVSGNDLSTSVLELEQNEVTE